MKIIAGLAVLAANVILEACSADAVPVRRETNESPAGASGAAEAAPVPAGRSVPDSPGSPPLSAAGGSSGQVGSPSNGVPGISTVNPIMIDHTGSNNPAGLGSDAVKRLMAGGPVGTLKWLYPYAGTVFPSGMLAPTLIWLGDSATDAIYVHIKSMAFEYRTVIQPTLVQPMWEDMPTTAQPQFPIPQSIWDMACAQTLGKKDTFTVELSTRVNGVVAGPIVTHFLIAPAPFTGSIYYTSFLALTTDLTTNLEDRGIGPLLRIPPRGKNQVAIAPKKGTCAGCHAVAANGSRVLSQTENIGATTAADARMEAVAYQLSPDDPATMPTQVGPWAAFSALYPDGSKFLASALTTDLQLGSAAQYTLYSQLAVSANMVPVTATLYDAVTAQVIPDTGIAPGALMPSFSPDGMHLTFNDADIDHAHGLAMMDYDPQHHKATNYRELTREPATNPPASFTEPGMRPAWPFFLPDNRAVVFTQIDSFDFTANLNGRAAPWTRGDRHKRAVDAANSDLYIVDVASGKTTVLAKAMGFNTPEDFAQDKPYLPFGLDDAHHNYAVTVSPVAVGGYFWIFWDSLRNYGDLGQHRQLWGAAIDIHPDGGYTTDPSHPAFYVTGQDIDTDNHRAFAVRDGCKPLDSPCQTGIDCCTGFCSSTCSSPPPHGTCSDRDQRCATDRDCCNPNDYCINGFCAFVPLL